jgi:hypothetical protein
MREPRKFRRPSHAVVVAYLALFVALGGTAIATSQLRKNTVGPKQLKKNAVTTPKVKKEAITGVKIKKGTLGGTQINVSSLGTVPSAQTAQTANSLAPPEGLHVVGAPGEPGFVDGWRNEGGIHSTVSFFKDHDGIVHLEGSATGGTSAVMFVLPPGYRPSSGVSLEILFFCGGGGECSSGFGRINVEGPGIDGSSIAGGVFVPGGEDRVVLDGISFRAQS